jgi:hypothetical protein
LIVFLLKVTVAIILVVVVAVVGSSEVLFAQGFVKQVQIDVPIHQGLLIKQLLLAKKFSHHGQFETYFWIVWANSGSVLTV